MVEETVDTAPKAPVIATPVVSIANGNMTFNNHLELRQAASMMIQIRLAPDHLKNEGVEAVAAALLFVKQRGLPQTAMNQCAYIKGKLTQFGSLVTALAERHPEYGEREDFFCDKDFNRLSFENKNLNSTPWAAVVRIRKKGGTIWSEYFFSVEDAMQAGLLTERTKPDSGWVKYVKDLLFHKANKRALSAQYASALEGINYHEDIAEVFELKDVTPPGSGAVAAARELEQTYNQVEA